MTVWFGNRRHQLFFQPLSFCHSPFHTFLFPPHTYKTPQSNQPATQSISPLRHNTRILKTQRATRKTAINLSNCLLTEATLLIFRTTLQSCFMLRFKAIQLWALNMDTHAPSRHLCCVCVCECYHANRVNRVK